MNIHRSTLRRRQLLKSGSIAAFGALSCALVGRRLFRFPGAPTPIATSAHPAPISPTTPVPSPLPPAAPPAPEEEILQAALGDLDPAPRPLSREEEYAEFLASLELRHISPDEIIKPHRGIYNGVDNVLPPEKLWKKLPHTLRVADEIRARLGIPLVKISSAYRCPSYNSQIPGAVRNSYHTRNQAIDVVYFCPVRKAYDMALKLRREGFFRGGIGLYPTFIHLDTRGYNATWRG